MESERKRNGKWTLGREINVLFQTTSQSCHREVKVNEQKDLASPVILESVKPTFVVVARLDGRHCEVYFSTAVHSLRGQNRFSEAPGVSGERIPSGLCYFEGLHWQFL